MKTFAPSLRSSLRPSLFAAACLMGASLAFAPQIQAQSAGTHTPHAESKAGCRGKHQATAEQRHEKRLQRMTQALDLTSEQQAKLKTVMTERYQTMQQQRHTYQQQLKTVLTDAQWQKWQAQKSQRMSHTKATAKTDS